MCPPLIDLTGKKFGRLTALERDFEVTSARPKWKCVCDCGIRVSVLGANLLRGHSLSCGCYKSEVLSSNLRNVTHGKSHSREWASWKSMHQRCRLTNSKDYINYGGRGITVCEQWNKFENFLADMGERPFNKTLDRIDVNGNYEPSNCRWATPKEQVDNRRPRKLKGR